MLTLNINEASHVTYIFQSMVHTKLQIIYLLHYSDICLERGWKSIKRITDLTDIGLK